MKLPTHCRNCRGALSTRELDEVRYGPAAILDTVLRTGEMFCDRCCAIAAAHRVYDTDDVPNAYGE